MPTRRPFFADAVDATDEEHEETAAGATGFALRDGALVQVGRTSFVVVVVVAGDLGGRRLRQPCSHF